MADGKGLLNPDPSGSREFESHRLRLVKIVFLSYNCLVNKNILYVGTALIAKKRTVNGYTWLLVKTKPESEWEFPKSVARKGESSVRATIRMTQEQFFMNAIVLQEADRFTGKASEEEKALEKMTLFYLMLHKSGGDDISGFTDHKWFDEKALAKKLTSKKEINAFQKAKKLLKESLSAKKKPRVSPTEPEPEGF